MISLIDVIAAARYEMFGGGRDDDGEYADCRDEQEDERRVIENLKELFYSE